MKKKTRPREKLSESVDFSLPAPMLAEIKQRAKKKHMSYQRYIREMLERTVLGSGA